MLVNLTPVFQGTFINSGHQMQSIFKQHAIDARLSNADYFYVEKPRLKPNKKLHGSSLVSAYSFKKTRLRPKWEWKENQQCIQCEIKQMKRLLIYFSCKIYKIIHFYTPNIKSPRFYLKPK